MAVDQHTIERIVRLETTVEDHERQLEASRKERVTLLEKVNAIDAKLDKQMSFVGGIVFVLSALWGLS